MSFLVNKCQKALITAAPFLVQCITILYYIKAITMHTNVVLIQFLFIINSNF